MPGLIVACDARGDAGNLARAAASPVVRQVWEQLRLWVASDGRTAVAFAGENGGVAVSAKTGCVAAVDGELFVGDVLARGVSAAEAVLLAYEGGGDPGCAEGAYAAAVWDPRSEVVVAATDRYATRPLYVAEQDGAILLAGELKSVPAAFGGSPALAADAVAVFLAYEHLLPGQAFLDGVDAVPAATTVTIRGPGSREHRRRWRYELAPEGLGDEREWVEEFARLLDRAVRRRAGARSAVALSGGLDSRCMILSLTRQGRVPATVSYGVPGSDDLRLGAAVAGSVGLSHRALTLRPGYLAAWAPEAAWLFEGRFRCLACHHLSLRALCGDGVDSVLIGFSGDDVLRTAEDVTSKDVDGAFVRRVHSLRAGCLNDEMLSDVLTPRFASVLRGRAEAALHSELVHDVGEPAARFAQLRFRSTQSPTLFADYFPARDPFADHQLVDFARTIPWALRRNGRLERLFLQTDARLARLPTTHHRAPPSASALGVEVAAANARLRRRLRPWTSQRTGLGSYAADLRGASRSLLNMLVEPRTLERDQLDTGAAHRLVEGTLAGRITDMRPIGVLLTLELFQRQFVDGDAPPWDGDLPAALRAQIPVDGAGNKRLAHAS